MLACICFYHKIAHRKFPAMARELSKEIMNKYMNKLNNNKQRKQGCHWTNTQPASFAQSKILIDYLWTGHPLARVNREEDNTVIRGRRGKTTALIVLIVLVGAKWSWMLSLCPVVRCNVACLAEGCDNYHRAPLSTFEHPLASSAPHLPRYFIERRCSSLSFPN